MRLTTWILAATAVAVARQLGKPAAAKRQQFRRAAMAPAAEAESQPYQPSPNAAEGLPAAGIGGQALADEAGKDPQAAMPGTRDFLRGA
jgi:hypothetical protein